VTEVLILQARIFFELALKKWKSFYTFKVYWSIEILLQNIFRYYDS